MKRYNLLNDCLGWLCFAIAAVTYLLTLEPTASFWDCPEFISQGYKLEVGHPPGNPIFMLAARFFVNFAGGDVSKVALMVNGMSALLSAATILLLFWTVTHLAKRLLVKDDVNDVSPLQMVLIFGAGLCGALAYTWSDTFWFSAVEGEVYAFSSFCTALVFWLILKWENRADSPHSDRYLVLIAYVIGISIAVHLLNLLCIPAIVLVVYYRKWAKTTAKGSLIALLVSFVIVGLILYGLVPGFIEVAQYFELFFVNTVGLSFNMGVLIYTVLLVACFIWSIRELYAERHPVRMKGSFSVMIILSGIPFIGDSLWVPVLVALGLVAYFAFAKKISVRILTLVTLSVFVIFIGYSSYALLLIRSTSNTPMNQNAPDNVFSLSSYLNREQYGERPLFYGQTVNSSIVYKVEGDRPVPMMELGAEQFAKAVKSSPDDPDRYVSIGRKRNYVMTPELDMVFPRIYSGAHAQAYKDWTGMTGRPVSATVYTDMDGNPLQKDTKIKPTMAENLKFFLIYQLNHMYWRYFMWNFAGRQNDIAGNGEVNQGNWISGIPFIDTPRLGDQSLMPYDMGEGNKGHNVFYMLPLLLGIIGLGWQAFTSKRGIEQFWVVFFLFFMTGIAIVLYLNQTPTQPRERDYAFAGSFYAFAIWIGLGVPGLWAALMKLMKKPSATMGAAVAAAAVGLIVPLQMVSQTWDDHDRSGRYTARDFGFNYLNSLDDNAIIFTNGDNDTFPLWYAQEVEGVRTDVRVVNLSYLATDWYANQLRMPAYNAAPVKMLATPADYAYDRLQFSYFIDPDTTQTQALVSLAALYDPSSDKNAYNLPAIHRPNMYVPVDREAMVKAGRITALEAQDAEDYISFNMLADPSTAAEGGMSLSKALSLDIIASSAVDGWSRPVYFATTVPSSYYLGLNPYLRQTGMAYEVSPIVKGYDGYNPKVNTDKMYRNVTERFRWGGLDEVKNGKEIYLDETVRRMVVSTRSAMADLAQELIVEGSQAGDSTAYAADRYKKARTVLDLMLDKLPLEAMPFGIQMGQQVAEMYANLGQLTGNKADTEKALRLIKDEIDQYSQNIVYYQSLAPWQYSTLPSADRWIEQYYYMSLLQSYSDMGGDVERALVEAQAKGVNFDRIAAFARQ